MPTQPFDLESAGAWTSYGLGTESHDLPGFVVLQSGSATVPHGGVGGFGNGFLPAQHQASIIKVDATEPVRNIQPREPANVQRQRLDFISSVDQRFMGEIGANSQVETAIQNYEMAWRMQSAVPELCDISGESEATKKLHGMDGSDSSRTTYAKQCLHVGLWSVPCGLWNSVAWRKTSAADRPRILGISMAI